MKKKAFLVFALCLAGCGDEHKEKNSDIDITETCQAFKEDVKNPRAITERCDGLTFIGLFDSATGEAPLDKYEYSLIDGQKVYETGKLNRDIEVCYPDGSRSEISFEGVLAWLRTQIKRGDKKAIKRAYSYLKENDWIAGRGPHEYTYMGALAPIFKKLLGRGQRVKFPKPIGSLWGSIAEGYRQNVVLLYIDVYSLTYGFIEGWMHGFIEKAGDTSLLSTIMYHAYIDGDQTESKELIEAGTFQFGWNDGPEKILKVYACDLLHQY